MCTFGELRLPSSRAFLDDGDSDDEVELPVLETQLREGVEVPQLASVLLACGELALGWGRELLRSRGFYALGSITATCGGQGDETLAELHALDATLLVLCSCQPRLASLLAEQVLTLCSGECSVAVLTSHHVSRLSTAGAAQEGDVLFCLPSPAAARLCPVTVARLPQPAFIDSVPAAVMTACTLRALPCVACVVYTETAGGGQPADVAEGLARCLQCLHPSLGLCAPPTSSLTSSPQAVHVLHNYT